MMMQPTMAVAAKDLAQLAAAVVVAMQEALDKLRNSYRISQRVHLHPEHQLGHRRLDQVRP